ncbi:MAG: hypothetical protein QNJ53_04285 [Pleurocapsa sp. MO_192.B19]|nr:hypothetical protein [Pleurocapsa sp. MO_192.B19]
MLKFINLKKLTAKTLIGILVAGSLVTQSGTKEAVAGQCDNNGHGNNGDITFTLSTGKEILLTKFDPSNPGNGNKIERELRDSNPGITDSEVTLAKAIIQNGDFDFERKPNDEKDCDTDVEDVTRNAAPVIEAPTTPIPTRTLVNPSFEYPAYSGRGTWKSLDSYIPGDDSTLQGWFSTHPTTGYSGYGRSRFKDAQGNPFKHLVELWVNRFQGVPAARGNQFAELNAQADSALYQDILVFAGEEIPWSAAHRGRQKDNKADVAEVFISDPNDWTGPTFSGNKLYSAQIETSKNGSISTINPSLGNVPNSQLKNPLSSGWVKYSDTWQGPSTSKKYRFAFQSISTGSGNNTVGNFLDDIQIKLSPIVDLVNPNIDEVDPLRNSIYYLPIRINGQSQSEATIEIDVSLGNSEFTDYTLETLASGSNTEVLNGVTATKLNNGNIQVTVPPNIYDPNNPDYYISVPINFNQVSSFNDQLANFDIVNVTGGGGQGVQNLLIPPADSGFSTTLETKVLASAFAD